MAKVSIIIPSRNEQFLVPTVNDLLTNAAGDIEIITVLDGYWEHKLPADKRLKVLHKGQSEGMRPAINDAAQIATGEYLMKIDGHCAVDHGYDEVLKRDCHEKNWLLIPRRYPLDPESWSWEKRKDHKYPIDYHYMVEPFGKYGDHVPGLHGTFWRERRDARADIKIDEELSSQGSCWFTHREHWNRIGPLDLTKYGNFWFENQEMALKTWCMGGAQMITKNTWYAHLYKGKRYGRGYSTSGMGHEAATEFVSWFWMTDQPFEGKTRTFRSVIEKFLPMPTWNDPDAIFERAHKEFKNPYGKL